MNVYAGYYFWLFHNICNKLDMTKHTNLIVYFLFFSFTYNMYVKITSTNVCTNIAWAFIFMAICLLFSFFGNIVLS